MCEIIEGLVEETKEVAEVGSDVAKSTELSTGEIGYIRECVSPLDVEALTTRIESVLDCSLAQAMENCPQIAEMLEPIKDQLPAELLSEGAPMEQGEILSDVDKINDSNETVESLSLTDKIRIKEETGWSDEIIDSIRSMEEAEIYMKAGLKEAVVGDKLALIQPNIDPELTVPEWYIEKYPNWESWRGWTNKDIVGEGYAPFTSPYNEGSEFGTDPYELHHIGQHPDSPLAELTPDQHRGGGNFAILHTFEESEVDREAFEKERSDYWQARYNVGW